MKQPGSSLREFHVKQSKNDCQVTTYTRDNQYPGERLLRARIMFSRFISDKTDQISASLYILND